MDPMTASEDEIRAHVATLTDEQLSDFLAAVDAAEVVARARTVKLGDAALWYAQALRWPVFPLKPRSKAPLTSHGFKDASTDPETVRAWWARWPEANIGVPTGRREQGGCGFDVIDIDGVPGFASLSALKHRNCPPDCSAETFCDATGALPPIAARAFTPGDPGGVVTGRPRGQGRHYYTPALGSSNTTAMVPGIDLRGDGGYVVAAPSFGPGGQRYAWLTWPVAA